MRTIYTIICLCFLHLEAGAQIRGTVHSRTSGLPLKGATVSLSAISAAVQTDEGGHFLLDSFYGASDSLEISFVGYLPKAISLARYKGEELRVSLEPEVYSVEEIEVISTGYQQLPRERATGSFEFISSDNLQRAIGGNILQRLDGLVPGLQFIVPGSSNISDVRVRGLSTIESDETPLVILDNFPYEGSLDNLDPNDIESITILKDAAASSIWGARAGNGVIVITSKSASRDGKKRLSMRANSNITSQPDLFYSPRWLPSEVVMAVERERYEAGHYNFASNVTNPYYAELLHMLETGQIDRSVFESEEKILKETDLRAQARDHLYRPSRFHQFALNASGSSGQYSYTMTSGYQKTHSGTVGVGQSRFNLGLRNRFRLHKNVDLGIDAAYVGHRAHANGITMSDLSILNAGVSPYLRLVDETGGAAVATKDISIVYAGKAEENNLLDWSYRPLAERELSNSTNFSNQLRLVADAKIAVLEGGAFDFLYRYTQDAGGSRQHYTKDSYYVRNLVNSFTQANGQQVIPHNGILRQGNPTEGTTHRGRIQFSYNRTFRNIHDISAIGGGEISQGISETYPASVLYNYHDDYLTGNSALNYLQNYERRPVGTGRIPGANDIRRKLTNRDLSYFGNTSYHFKKRYGLSGSIRWDGSNLFGVKTNQKGVPLWSVGGSWEPSGERFYPIRDWLAYLRIRATYGISGNVNRSETHFPVSRYTTNSQGLLVGSFNSIGNPSLRWEKVKTTNLGAEWRVAGNRVRGRVEYYTKRGTDLIGDYEMDPTLGITGSYKINYADISTRGWDVNINMKNPIRSFLWVTDVNLSVVRNEITNFNTREDRPVFEYFYDTPPPRVGVSRDIVYAIPWNGLSADTGLPIVYMDGVEVTDYRQYYNNHLAPEQLTAIGLSVPPHYGALRNTFSWRGLELSTVISWKSGHVFRRMSMLPTDEYYMNYHQDYYHRWKSPGDEKTTNVPAKLPITAMGTSQAFSGEIYAASEALIESGDLIRFQEMSCSYSFSDRNLKKTPFAAIRINAYFRNLGILWKATPSDLDPDYHSASYTPPFSFSFGLQLDF